MELVWSHQLHLSPNQNSNKESSRPFGMNIDLHDTNYPKKEVKYRVIISFHDILLMFKSQASFQETIQLSLRCSSLCDISWTLKTSCTLQELAHLAFKNNNRDQCRYSATSPDAKESFCKLPWIRLYRLQRTTFRPTRVPPA